MRALRRVIDTLKQIATTLYNTPPPC